MIKKINLIRFFVFLISMVALSRFFEAGRLISQEQTFVHLGTSIFSLLVFIFTLVVLGYWVYIDEKEKNNLRVKFGLYEWFYNNKKEARSNEGKK